MAAMENIRIRPATMDDLDESYDVFLRATAELHTRVGVEGQAPTIEKRRRALAFRRHTLEHDPLGFWVAERSDGHLVGFGIAIVRADIWYLAALHVLPEFQGRGIGRTLLERCLSIAANTSVRTTITEAIQPISNALYAKHGMYPSVPLVYLEGSPRTPVKNTIPAYEIVDDSPSAIGLLDQVDQDVLGYVRSIDHRFWLRQEGLHAVVVHGDTRPVGYAYVASSGGIGPAAASSPDELPNVLRAAIALVSDQGRDSLYIPVPGHCRQTVKYLLDLGLRYGPSMNIILASRQFGHLDRYLPPAGDALF